MTNYFSRSKNRCLHVLVANTAKVPTDILYLNSTTHLLILARNFALQKLEILTIFYVLIMYAGINQIKQLD